MAGVATGLDWASTLAMLPQDADRERVILLLREWEIGALQGAAEKVEKS